MRQESDPSPGKPIVIPAWSGFRWLRHGFSTRGGGTSTVYTSSNPESHEHGVRSDALEGAGEAQAPDAGEMNLGFTADDDPDRVRENRRLFQEALGAAAMHLVAARQVHGVEILRVDRPEQTGLAADGLVTDRPGLLLGMQAADCAPVLLLDARLRAVAALHAGWRGTAAAIVEHGVRRMGEEFGSRPEDLHAAVGPAIGPCCYTVGEEVRECFTERFAYGAALFSRAGAPGTLRLDLPEAHRRQLRAAGVPAGQIVLTAECTACARTAAATSSGGLRRFFSHRGEGGRTGRAMGAIGIVAG